MALLTGRITFDPASLPDFQAWELVANPSSIEASAWLAEQQKRLASSRQALRREIENYRKTAEEVAATASKANLEAVTRYRRLAAALIRAGRRRAGDVQRGAERQVELIQSTRQAYEEQMRLKAPVRYWATKKRSHESAAKGWGVALALYVLGAIIAFGVALYFAWSALPADGPLTGRHVLLVASIGALLTLLFWGARLGVRIYLGERHLATDAEERRVMIQAYLALIKEAGASEEERMVILSALFRSAQDGIVKEDGAGDISLPAMIARMLDARRTA